MHYTYDYKNGVLYETDTLGRKKLIESQLELGNSPYVDITKQKHADQLISKSNGKNRVTNASPKFVYHTYMLNAKSTPCWYAYACTIKNTPVIYKFISPVIRDMFIISENLQVNNTFDDYEKREMYYTKNIPSKDPAVRSFIRGGVQSKVLNWHGVTKFEFPKEESLPNIDEKPIKVGKTPRNLKLEYLEKERKFNREFLSNVLNDPDLKINESELDSFINMMSDDLRRINRIIGDIKK